MFEAELCYCCGAAAAETLFHQQAQDPYLELIGLSSASLGQRWVVCRDCGFVYQTPRLDDADMDKLYRDYRLNDFRGETPDAYFDRISSYPPEQSENHHKVAWLTAAGAVEREAEGRILDIGCGGGLLLHSFHKRYPAWTLAGVEPTPNFAELAARRLGCRVHSGNYGEGLFAEPFDLITIIQVLEHVADPAVFLTTARRDLADGGRLYVEVPDVSDFGHLPLTHDRFMAPHLWYFGESSLARICRRAGFEPVRVEREFTVRERNNLRLLCRKAEPVDRLDGGAMPWQKMTDLVRRNPATREP
jgi:SAM-dependent methyltransferase